MFWKELLLQGLKEDQWQWDWSTKGSVKASRGSVAAEVIAKSEGIWAAEGLVKAAAALSQDFDFFLEINSKIKDGERFSPGQKLLVWNGNAQVILGFERAFLNLSSYTSGIATHTRTLVDLVEKAWGKTELKNSQRKIPRVTATRKTLPQYRDLAVYAVQVGGGFSHRLSLSSGILIKENHIKAAGGIKNAVLGVREISPHGLKIEVEVRNQDELREGLALQVDALLLDNFSVQEVKDALRIITKNGNPVCVEVSGGLNEKNISEYVLEGVQILSVGSLTHSVRSADFSLLVC